MSKTISTDDYSLRLRSRSVRLEDRKLLIARIAGSQQAKDLSDPPNCAGLGRVRHFRREPKAGSWPQNPLPIDPASRALGLAPGAALRAQVFQNGACNWRCWYCFVPFELLDARADLGAWVDAAELVDLYLSDPEATRPLMIDLTGGQPDLVPEWVPWMMEELQRRGLEGRVYLWSDDNLSTDYFWRFLSNDQQRLVASFKAYGRVGCFKGFDSPSFSFNTRAAPELFDRQFELFSRMLTTGVDLYAYTTFTAQDSSTVDNAMPRFVDRLQAIDPNLPLRTVPLKVEAWGVVSSRLSGPGESRIDQCVWDAQERAIEAWQTEVEKRFGPELRAKAIVDVSLGARR